MAIDDLNEFDDKPVETGCNYEAKVNSEQQAEEASTREVAVKKTQEFVEFAMAEMCARCVAAGVLGRLSKPEQLINKLVDAVLVHEAKVRREQQVAAARLAHEKGLSHRGAFPDIPSKRLRC